MKRPVIIGGGLAGAAAACRLPGALVVERSPGPHHKVCGEFLSIEAQAELAQLGLDLEKLGAVPIHALRLAAGRRMAEAALPFRGVSLSRFVLDEALLARAAALGAELRRGTAVRRLEELGDGPAILATGKHELRGAPRDAARSGPIGLKLHLSLAPAEAASLAGHVELHLFPGGYAGLEPVEDGRANLCLVVEPATYGALGRSWSALLEHIGAHSALFRRRLAEAQPCWEAPLAVAALPYGYLHEGAEERFYRVGDQLAVISSLTGDGMAMALHSARCAAEAVREGGSASLYHRRLAAELKPQMRRAAALAALSRPRAGQHLLVLALRLFPALAAAAASGTRLPRWRDAAA